MSNAATFIEAIAAFTAAIGAICAVGVWPLFGLVVIGLFREEIRALIGRVRSGKVLGQEFDFLESVSRIDMTVRGPSSGSVTQSVVQNKSSLGLSAKRLRKDYRDVLLYFHGDWKDTVSDIDRLVTADISHELQRLGVLQASQTVSPNRALGLLTDAGYPKIYSLESYMNAHRDSLKIADEDIGRMNAVALGILAMVVLDDLTEYVDSVVTPQPPNPPAIVPPSATDQKGSA